MLICGGILRWRQRVSSSSMASIALCLGASVRADIGGRGALLLPRRGGRRAGLRLTICVMVEPAEQSVGGQS
jgi:hypothetical protein